MERRERGTRNDTTQAAIKDIQSEFKTVKRGGRVYIAEEFYRRNYDMKTELLQEAYKLGMPRIFVKGKRYINKQDFHDFHAGKICPKTADYIKKRKLDNKG